MDKFCQQSESVGECVAGREWRVISVRRQQAVRWLLCIPTARSE